MGGFARDAGARALGPRGFTLLELLITLSVTTIGLLGLVSLHVSVVRGNDGASRSAEAQQITVNRLESLRAQRLVDMMRTLTGAPVPPPAPPPAPATTPPQISKVAGRANMTYTVTATATTLADVSSSLIKIRVVTTWTEDGGGSGANALLTHALALEVIRTLEDAP
ncbi:MAG TPA: prepilin-type N-terminal cleavage/methylation domain-containing protein [Kofleriaceae bacterium]